MGFFPFFLGPAVFTPRNCDLTVVLVGERPRRARKSLCCSSLSYSRQPLNVDTG